MGEREQDRAREKTLELGTGYWQMDIPGDFLGESERAAAGLEQAQTRRDLTAFHMNPDKSFLLLVDLQERLVPVMRQGGRCVRRALRLLKAAGLFEIPGLATEQYPKGLGPSVPEIGEALGRLRYPIYAKTAFSALTDEVQSSLAKSGRKQVILFGVETHVCVWQTVRALLEAGYSPVVPADAVSSRYEDDRVIGLRLMERAGAVVTSTESILFDWAGDAKSPMFKAVSALVKDEPSPPGGRVD